MTWSQNTHIFMGKKRKHWGQKDSLIYYGKV